MISPNKILTVSFGTFSCTLEGFEDSFGTMKDIAEYFRDLAAENPHFGAEPAKLDTDALARIAARNASRQVEAHQHGHEVTLRPTAPEHDQQPELDNATHAAADPQIDADHDGEPAQAFTEPDFIPPTPRATPQMDDASIAAKLRRIRAVTGGSAIEPLQEMFTDAEPTLVDDAPEASFFDSSAAVADHDLDAHQTADVEDHQTVDISDAPVAPAEPAPADEPEIDLEQLAEAVTAEDAIETIADLEPEDEATIALSDDEDRSEPDLDAIAALVAKTSDDSAIDAPAAEDIVTPSEAEVTVADAELVDAETDAPNEDPLSAISETLAEVAEPEPAQDEIATNAADMELDPIILDQADLASTPVETAHDAADMTPAEPTAEDDSSADDVAALLSDTVSNEAVSDEAADIPADDGTDQSDSAETDDVTPRVRARIIRMRRRAASETQAETVAEADAPIDAGETTIAAQSPVHDATDLDGLDDLDDLSDLAALDDLGGEDAVDAASDTAPVSAPEAATAIRPRRPQRRQDVEDELPRLISEADTALDAPEASARRNALAHLKAAIAATEAARKLGDDDSDATTTSHLFRDDLEAQIGDAEQGSLAPLRLVASQRVDTETPDQPPETAILDLDEPADEPSRIDRYIAFCESTKAGDEAQLLESAAVFLHDHEGQAHFSRRELMQMLRDYDPELFDRSQGVKAFRALLEQGRLSRVNNGLVTVTDLTSYREERQRA